MKGLRLRCAGEHITWLDQVVPWGRKASSTRDLKPQTSNLELLNLRFLVGATRAVNRAGHPVPCMCWTCCRAAQLFTF